MGEAEGYKGDAYSRKKVIVTTVEALAPVYTPLNYIRNTTLRFL